MEASCYCRCTLRARLNIGYSQHLKSKFFLRIRREKIFYILRFCSWYTAKDLNVLRCALPLYPHVYRKGPPETLFAISDLESINESLFARNRNSGSRSNFVSITMLGLFGSHERISPNQSLDDTKVNLINEFIPTTNTNSARELRQLEYGGHDDD